MSNKSSLPSSIQNLPSVMTHDFSKVPDVQLERSKFKRDHAYKTTFDAGKLIPFYIDEVLPGDSHTVSAEIFGRLATPIKPFMDNMFMDTLYFFVPMRQLWEHTQNFFGERKPNPASSISYTVPTVAMPASTASFEGSIWDYMGLPKVASLAVNSLPLRAYNLIYNEWFRDENLIDGATFRLTDAGDVDTDFAIRKSGKGYDYFTSCLTSPQKGTAVTIPVGSTSAPVALVPFGTNANAMLVKKAADDTLSTGVNVTGRSVNGKMAADNTDVFQVLDPNGRLVADLSSAFATTINDLRYAVQLQTLLEIDARGGTRYTEHNWAHFKVKSSDLRLQRPQYLGGGSSPVNLHPVAQTTSPATPGLRDALGGLGGFGTVSGRNHGFSQSFEEHGYIIGLVRVCADLTYQQGLDKMWSRSTRYDFPYPVFAHIGEQAVLSKEIYCDGTGGDANTFGYQERYAEMRYKNSKITGQFRSSAATPLDYWHLCQNFGSRPTLNQAFIEVDNSPIDRGIAVPSEPQFLFDSLIHVTSARPLPVYGVPQLGGRF